MTGQWLGKRIMIKLSGEALMGDRPFGIDPKFLDQISADLKHLVDGEVQVAVVVGGGNLVRGMELAAGGMDRVLADHMGMMATVMNGVALRAALASIGVGADLFSGLAIPAVCETFTQRVAEACLDRGRVALFVGGTGLPFFTTDTSAALRAAEMRCNVLLKGTQVDGVYTADPKQDPSATHIPDITFDDVIAQGLKVMDTGAITLARESDIQIIVFDLHRQRSIVDAAAGRGRHSRVHG